jgi:hypothetical protein
MELKAKKEIAIIEDNSFEYRQCKEEWSQLFNNNKWYQANRR